VFAKATAARTSPAGDEAFRLRSSISSIGRKCTRKRWEGQAFRVRASVVLSHRRDLRASATGLSDRASTTRGSTSREGDEDYLEGLAKEAGIEKPTRTNLAKLDRKRRLEASS